MMIRRLTAVSAFACLISCGGNPIAMVEPPEPPSPPGEIGEEAPIAGVQVPAVIANHLRSANYSPGAASMRIDLRTLDGTPLEATYQRDDRLSLAGYDAFTVQETRSQRKFLALFRQSGAAVQAGVVADGGQFANYFAGGSFTQLQPFSAPTGNKLLATYSGAYVGLLNTGAVVPGSEQTLQPRQSYRVSGDVALNADFNPSNMSVAGQIANRSIVETGQPLQTVYFWVADVNGQGAFSGTIRADASTTVGNYAGVFGGAGAGHVAGATVLRPDPNNGDLKEHGAFAIPVCAAGSPPPCP